MFVNLYDYAAANAAEQVSDTTCEGCGEGVAKVMAQGCFQTPCPCFPDMSPVLDRE